MTAEERAIQQFSRSVLKACNRLDAAFRRARTNPLRETRLEAYARSYYLSGVRNYANGQSWGGVPHGLVAEDI